MSEPETKSGPKTPMWAEKTAAKDLLILRTFAERPDWFPKKIEARLIEGDDGCRLWTGGLTRSGYGKADLPAMVARRATVRVHRVTYLQVHGAIGYGLGLDHTCTVRNCANVEHLEPVTQKINLLRGNTINAGYASRTHCSEGHPLDGPDALLVPSGVARGGRECSICHQERARRQAVAIGAAHRALGLTKREYVRLFGRSAATAEGVVEALAMDRMEAR